MDRQNGSGNIIHSIETIFSSNKAIPGSLRPLAARLTEIFALFSRSVPGVFSITVQPIERQTMAVTTKAVVAQSCWRAQCPSCSCVQPVSLEDPRFLCVGCANAAFGYRPIVLDLPAAGDISNIEKVLLLRPDPNKRNWHPSQNINDLILENETHGIHEHKDVG